MLEIEKKYELADRADFVDRLTESGAVEGKTERHADTYYRHPSRDFVQTNEALRIRSVDSVASITYKGPKMDLGDPHLKARQEIEWCLAPGDSEGSQMASLLVALGFSAVTTVRKRRQSFHWPAGQPEMAGFTLTVDDVEQLGTFAEIELLIPDGSSESPQAAGARINELADRLGLSQSVRYSYLQMLLNKLGE